MRASRPLLLALNKPHGVICQFSPHPTHACLRKFVDLPEVYPAGRLDTDSEGLLLLTSDGALQHRIAAPAHKLEKRYWVQVEGLPDDASLRRLRGGLDLGDFTTAPCQARCIDEPAGLWPRTPPVRFRRAIPTSWMEITLTEGKNRQVRRMTAKIGFPTLRLIRESIGPYRLGDLLPGRWRRLDPSKIALPARQPAQWSGRS